MVVGGIGIAGPFALSRVKVGWDQGQDSATSLGHILKDFHVQEMAQMKFHATLICVMHQVCFHPKYLIIILSVLYHTFVVEGIEAD